MVMGPALGPNALKSCPRTPTLMGPTSRSNSLGSRVGPKGNGLASGSNFLESSVRTRLSSVRRQDSIVLGLASRPNSIGSFFKTQDSWVLAF